MSIAQYVMDGTGLYRVLDDGTYVLMPRPKPMPAGVILSEEECAVRRGYWEALKQGRYQTPLRLAEYSRS